MAVDLHKLEHLVAVGEEGSLTRAAARLHLSQQALSASIRTLEREVGVELLDRRGSRASLRPAGQALVTDAHAIHGLARAALRRARHIGRGEPDLLRVGHTPAVTGEEVTTLLAPLRDQRPDLATEVNQRYPNELTTQLLADDLDLGLARAMTPARGLSRTVLGHHRLRIAVAAEHPLATTNSVALPDLADEHFLVWGTPGRSGYTDLLIDQCRHAGFEPHIQRTPVQGTPPVTAVIGRDRLAFVTAKPGPAAGGRTWVLELDPPLFAPLHALWPHHTQCDARDTLLNASGHPQNPSPRTR
jgi:DNA-binding transcriptional LysR family regulator